MTPPPCTCGKTATGLVVEGHLHPYCAWEAERARAERAEQLLDGLLMLTHDDHETGPCQLCETLEEARRWHDALAADREGRLS